MMAIKALFVIFSVVILAVMVTLAATVLTLLLCLLISDGRALVARWRRNRRDARRSEAEAD